jgi:hypothetical protein
MNKGDKKKSTASGYPRRVVEEVSRWVSPLEAGKFSRARRYRVCQMYEVGRCPHTTVLCVSNKRIAGMMAAMSNRGQWPQAEFWLRRRGTPPFLHSEEGKA